LLILADCDVKTRETCLEFFACSLLAISTLTHQDVSSIPELSKIVKAFRNSDEAAFEKAGNTSCGSRKGTRPKGKQRSSTNTGVRSNEQILREPTVEEYWH